jgi:hypothetical protein
MEAGGSFGAGVAEALVFVGSLEELDYAISDRGRGFDRSNNPGLVVEGSLDESRDGINDCGGAHGVGFEDVQAPAFADGGVNEEMGLAELGVLLRFTEHAGEGHTSGHSISASLFAQLRLDFAAANDGQLGRNSAFVEDSSGLDSVVDAFVRGETGDRDEA